MLQALFAALFGWLLPKRRRKFRGNQDFYQLDHPMVFDRGVPIGLVMPKEPPTMEQILRIDSELRRLALPHDVPDWRFSDVKIEWKIDPNTAQFAKLRSDFEQKT